MQTQTQGPKYALVDESTGRIVETIADSDNAVFLAADAFNLADILVPDWRERGLKLWLRVGRQ